MNEYDKAINRLAAHIAADIIDQSLVDGDIDLECCDDVIELYMENIAEHIKAAVNKAIHRSKQTTVDPIRAKAVLMYHDPEFQYYCGQLGLRTFEEKWEVAVGFADDEASDD